MDHNIQFFLEIEINPFTKSEKPAKCTTDLYIPNKFYIKKKFKEIPDLVDVKSCIYLLPGTGAD
jgi:hypothetical protein